MLRLKLLCHNKNNCFYHFPRHSLENVMSAILFNFPLGRGPAQPEGGLTPHPSSLRYAEASGK